MPLHKNCPPPADGGSAKGVVRYILGYELGAKREEWEVRNASYHALIAESLQRPDLGVGRVWSPQVGAGIRPSSVLVQGFASLATADIEMQALHRYNPRVKVAAIHEVFAFGDDVGITDEQMLEAVSRIYGLAGLGGCAVVMSVHRDTFHEDGRVKPHVHCARSPINPATLRAYDHQRINTRIARAERTVELQMGLAVQRNDLAVVDFHSDGTAFVRDSTVPERIAHRREQREDRLIDLERARYADNALREGSFERFAEARIEPRLREVLQRAKDLSERVHAVDVTNAAARLATVFQVRDDGHLQLRDISTARLRAQQQEEMQQAKLEAADTKGLVRDERLGALAERQKKELVAEVHRLLEEGEVAVLTPTMEKELRAALRDPRILADDVSVERVFVAAVDKDPGLVARALTRSRSTFGRDDVDRYLVDRIADVGEVERLAQRIFTEDRDLVLLGQRVLTQPPLVLHSPDEGGGVWTTREMLQIEAQLAEDAQALAHRPGKSTAAGRDAAIAALEASRSTPDEPFRLSDEQRHALAKNGGLVCVRGIPGAGKTTLMKALEMECRAADRPIRGVTIAQAAAIRLEVEAGLKSVNTAFALLADSPQKELIPRGGILIVDEAGMVDSRTMHALLRLARQRDTDVWAIYGLNQSQPVAAGGSARILEAAARDADTFAELHENRRQKHAWHRDAVRLVGGAIDGADASTFKRGLELLLTHGALEFVDTKDAAIAATIEWYQAERAKSNDVLLVATDRDTVRYLNEELVRRREDRGSERRYFTEDGTRGLAVGDRFIFGQNDSRIGVVNGDTGTVRATGRNLISVQLDRGDSVTSFDARKYVCWDHGYATTVAKATGASVRALGGIADGATTAEAFHVLISRSKEALRVFAPQTAFEGVEPFAEHLCERIEAKGTTQDISAEISKLAGPDTLFTDHALAAQLSAANPARQAWEAEWTAMRTQRDREIRDLAAAYRAKVDAAPPEQHKTLRQEQRKLEAAIVKAHEPQDFPVWLRDRRQQEKAQTLRLDELAQRRQANEIAKERDAEQAQARQQAVAAKASRVVEIRRGAAIEPEEPEEKKTRGRSR